MPNSSDQSPENKLRFDQYLERANYVNVSGRTLSGLVGEVYAKEPVIELPAAIEAFKDDIDGAGNTLLQQSKRTLTRTIKQGRSALFVDFPTTEGEVKKQAIDSGYVRPVIISYPAAQIINWRTERIGSKTKLSLVVLQEERENVDPEDPFVTDVETTYRVLSLESGVYIQRIYVKGKDEAGKDEWVQDGPDIIPTKGEGGSTFDEIPFQFCGSINNDADVDKSAILDLCNVNIAHYRNSADSEDSSHFAGQPTYHLDIGEMDHTQWQEANPGGLRVGSRGGVQTRGGSLDMVQPDANILPKSLMEEKEKQMVALGARIIEPQSQAITATEAASNNASETSILSTIVDNVSQSYVQALQWMGEFLKASDGEITFELNNDFSVSKLDPQEMLAVIQGWQSGLISKFDAHAYTQRVGIASKDYDATEDDIDDNPAGLNITTEALTDGA